MFKKITLFFYDSLPLFFGQGFNLDVDAMLYEFLPFIPL